MFIRVLCAVCALCLSIFSSPAAQMKRGELLRFHVVAQDDTPAMQSLKLPVRDAVQRTFLALAPRSGAMAEEARALLPELTQAASQAALDAGFTGPVSVTLENAVFDSRLLDGHFIPAGVYPALMVRMGDARGHNWWGLLDPETALAAASFGEGADGIEWDWSLQALLQALLGWMGGWADA